MARRISRSIVDIPGEYSYLRQLDPLFRQEIFDWLDLDDVVKLRFCCRELVSSRYVLNRLNHDGLIISQEIDRPLRSSFVKEIKLSRSDDWTNRNVVVDEAIELARDRSFRQRTRMLIRFRANANRFRFPEDMGSRIDDRRRGGEEEEVDRWLMRIFFSDWDDRNNLFDELVAYMIRSVEEVYNTNLTNQNLLYRNNRNSRRRYCMFTEWMDCIINETIEYSRVRIKYQKFDSRGEVVEVKEKVVIRMKTRNGQVFEYYSSSMRW